MSLDSIGAINPSQREILLAWDRLHHPIWRSIGLGGTTRPSQPGICWTRDRPRPDPNGRSMEDFGVLPGHPNWRSILHDRNHTTCLFHSLFPPCIFVMDGDSDLPSAGGCPEPEGSDPPAEISDTEVLLDLVEYDFVLPPERKLEEFLQVCFLKDFPPPLLPELDPSSLRD